MSISTATVETLVAEVRVLMVGSRQITLSVARQLDRVGLGDIDAFGRIELGLDYGMGAVIGRQQSTGALVTATYDKSPLRTTYFSVVDLPGKVGVCSRLHTSSQTVSLKFNTEPIIVDENAVAFCDIDDHRRYHGAGRCDHWATNGQDAIIEAKIAETKSVVQRHLRAAALPLIVLAGLR